MQLKPEQLLQGGKYKIIKPLGQGGFGITYLAEQTLMERKVCIKEFFMKEYCDRDEATSQVSLGTTNNKAMMEKYQEKFLKEARMIARLDHPNIIRIFDVFTENNTAYYVMEYIDGKNLNEIVKERGALPEAVAVEYVRQIGEGLAYVHERNINHLDIKPGNILIRKSDNRPILIDFGMSKQYNESGDQTSSTPLGISAGYAPLEMYQAGGVSSFSPQTDVYGLGATLYYMVTGTVPPSASDVMNEGLPEMPGYLSDSIKTAIEKAMEFRKKDRPETVALFMSMLNAAVPGNFSKPAVSPSTRKTDDSEAETILSTSATKSSEKVEKTETVNIDALCDDTVFVDTSDTDTDTAPSEPQTSIKDANEDSVGFDRETQESVNNPESIVVETLETKPTQSSFNNNPSFSEASEKKKNRRKGCLFGIIGIIGFTIILGIILSVLGDDDLSTSSYSNPAQQAVEFVVEKPNFSGSILSGPSMDDFKLKLSTSRRNDTNNKDWIANSDWYNTYDLIPNVNYYTKDNTDLSIFPQQYKSGSIHSCCGWGDHFYVYYGNNYSELFYLIITDTDFNVQYKLDFSNFVRAPYTNPGDESFVFQSIRRAVIVGDVLYVQHGHNTYAYSSRGDNAYISAIDLRQHKILWTTVPLTCNSEDFIIVNNTIICGYGFTQEEDYVYLVDMATGKRRQTIKVASGPETIVFKNDKVYVRTYNTDYVFDII